MKLIIMHYNSEQIVFGLKLTSDVQHVKIVEWHVMAVPTKDEEVTIYDYTSVPITSWWTFAWVLGGHQIRIAFSILKTIFLTLKLSSFYHLIAPFERRIWVFNKERIHHSDVGWWFKFYFMIFSLVYSRW